MNQRPQVLQSREIYNGRIVRLRIDSVQDGTARHEMEIVEHPGSFAIAALPDGNHLLLIRQYRHAAGGELWEIPAGTAEPKESCEAGARRELEEETGFRADRLELLCTTYPTPGYCTERVHLFAARGLHAGAQHLEQDERIEVRQVSFQDAWRMQASGEIVDMKTMLALLWLAGASRSR
jgi:ADP-ribose diphosphatase